MSFQHGLSGLGAATKNLDVISNNVSNANTVGFKGSIAQFADLFAAGSSGGGASTEIGIGSSLAAVLPQFTQGNISVTNNPLDLAINGQGFFRISDQGAISYTRDGQYQLDKTGYVVNSSGARLTGYPVDTAGDIVSSSPQDLKITTSDIAPSATTAATVAANLDSRSSLATAPFSLSNGSTFNSASSLTVYDSLGNPHTLSLYFAKSAANTWDVYAANDGTQIGAASVGQLSFLSSGTLDTATSTFPSVSIPLTNGANSPLAISVGMDETTQFGSAFGVTTLSQDGYSSGQLSGFSVDDNGVILARYSNGQTRKQGQVVLVNFTSPQALRALGANAWAETSASGAPLVGSPGSGNLGVLQSGAVEQSNVDLTSELVAMITAQRVYQANAQSIKTQDSVLQTLVNMR